MKERVCAVNKSWFRTCDIGLYPAEGQESPAPVWSTDRMILILFFPSLKIKAISMLHCYIFCSLYYLQWKKSKFQAITKPNTYSSAFGSCKEQWKQPEGGSFGPFWKRASNDFEHNKSPTECLDSHKKQFERYFLIIYVIIYSRNKKELSSQEW